MRLCLDSSALAKRYVLEPGTPAIVTLCQQAEEIVLSVLCMPEILSALNRLRREEKLSTEAYLQLKQSFLADFAEATIVDLTREVLSHAVVCLETTALRTLDAIHVASAAKGGCDLFVSADQRQCRGAIAMGIRVLDFSALARPRR